MKRLTKHGLFALFLCAVVAFLSAPSGADDIDIFVGGSAGAAAYPKILIVLDNTSNWSRASQKWPGGIVQGQAEVSAINTVLGTIGSNISLGLMEFDTGGTATQDGGYIRQAVVPMTDANKTIFSASLNTIYNNINSPNEKTNSGMPYGDLMEDAYNYFNGLNCLFPTAVVTSLADPNGYTSPYTTFRSPLSDSNACGNNYIIFIGNPDASGPSTDSAANGAALTALGGSISPDLLVPGFTSASTTISTNLAYTTQCYGSLSACSTTDNTYNATQCASGNYASCSCSNTITTTSLDACAAGTQRYSVYGVTVTGGTPTTTTANVANPTKGISGCYASSADAAAAGDKGGLSDPVDSTTTSGGTTTQISYTNIAYTPGTSPSTNTTQNCAASATTPSTYSGNPNPYTTFLSYTATANNCYKQGTWDPSDIGNLSTSYPNSVTVSGNTTTTTVYTVTGTSPSYGSTSGCTASGTKQVTVTQTVQAVSTAVTSVPNYKYDVTQTYTQTTTTTPGSTTTQTLLGNTAQCYASCNTSEFSGSSSYNGGYVCGTPTASAGLCTSGARYMVQGNNTGTVVTPTGTYSAPSQSPVNADEWAEFMHQAQSINSASTTDTIHQPITTYTIDVFNAQQNADETSLYMSMARVGGGKYFSATNQSQIVAALQSILAEIQSVNSTFASASLPVNATNRTQNANQVFIGMFRPDPQANPRWYGNLKQYQIGNVNGSLDLVDANGNPATNTLTGFIADCAVSFWTTNSTWPTNSTNYWANIVDNPDPASNCIPSTLTTLGGAVYSDLPDGPTVEKGAVAEILRKGNDPGATPTWTTVDRNVLTLSSAIQTSGALVPFNTINVPSLPSNVVQFAEGIDVNNSTGLYNAITNPYQTRPGIHGDVVHSRPLPVNYGNGVTVYYGANDGTLRAVDSSTGRERWAFIAPEHYSKLQRLMANSPCVNYDISATSGCTNKDYFFDGSIGVYQAAASGTNPPVWIYPTERRGGRMVYAFDVSDPTVNPTLKWRHGCWPNPLGGADVCDDPAFSNIGETWSTPNVAFINGYSTSNTTKPVVVMGGGYDPCEDADTTSPSCPSTTPGNVIYFIDADTGALITSFTTLRSVAADVTLIDVNNDGLVDYAYAADTGGNIYRIDFVSSPTTMNPLTPSSSANNTAAGNWYIHRVAYTNGGGRKFLFGPALFPSGTSAYLAIVSGDREHPLITDYPYTTPVINRAYVYKDDLTSTPSTAAVNLDDPTLMMNVTDADSSTCTSTNLLSDTSYKGWYMDLTANGPGEQGVTSAVIVGGMVTFSTNRPLNSSLSCSTRLGEARGYFVNLFNGSGSIGTANNASCGGARSSIFAGGGLPPSPVIGIVPINGVPTAVLIGAPSRNGSANSPIKPTKVTPPINQMRRRTYKYFKGID
jgi:Tfp pilus tip-associated adhesin PilY1